MMIIKKSHWRVVFAICFTMSFILGGCANKQPQRMGLPAPAPTGQSASMSVADTPTFSGVRVYKDKSGRVWVPLEETAKSMGFDLHNTDAGFSMGHTDPVYTVKVNQTSAVQGDQAVQLPHAPVYFDQKPYMTTQALSALIGTPVNWNEQNARVVITPVDDSSLSGQANAGPSQQQGSSAPGTTQSFSLTTSNKTALIAFGRQFLGTPYQFSAGPYNRTHRFDCSSFVQYVYAHFGVSLPRASRSQAQVGQSVTMNQLQTGDLMFFYTPGRYASNRIVGHVGIYAGNGQIIHTYGRPGVTFTNFNAYWKHRFLFGRRVS